MGTKNENKGRGTLSIVPSFFGNAAGTFKKWVSTDAAIEKIDRLIDGGHKAKDIRKVEGEILATFDTLDPIGKETARRHIVQRMKKRGLKPRTDLDNYGLPQAIAKADQLMAEYTGLPDDLKETEKKLYDIILPLDPSDHNKIYQYLMTLAAEWDAKTFGQGSNQNREKV